MSKVIVVLGYPDNGCRLGPRTQLTFICELHPATLFHVTSELHVNLHVDYMRLFYMYIRGLSLSHAPVAPIYMSARTLQNIRRPTSTKAPPHH